MGAGNNKKPRRLAAAAIIALLVVVVVAVVVVFAIMPMMGGSQGQSSATAPVASSPVSASAIGQDDESTMERITPEEAYEHATIVSKTEAWHSTTTMTEADAVKLFAERGFGSVSVMTSYDFDGSFHDEQEVDAGSSSAHPIYEATYVAEDGRIWQLYLYNGHLMANPVFYNFGNSGVHILLSETETMVSYYSATNTFYEIVPDGTTSKVKKVARIDAAFLDSLTAKGVDAL